MIEIISLIILITILYRFEEIENELRNSKVEIISLDKKVMEMSKVINKRYLDQEYATSDNKYNYKESKRNTTDFRNNFVDNNNNTKIKEESNKYTSYTTESHHNDNNNDIYKNVTKEKVHQNTKNSNTYVFDPKITVSIPINDNNPVNPILIPNKIIALTSIEKVDERLQELQNEKQRLKDKLLSHII